MSLRRNVPFKDLKDAHLQIVGFKIPSSSRGCRSTSDFPGRPFSMTPFRREADRTCPLDNRVRPPRFSTLSLCRDFCCSVGSKS